MNDPRLMQAQILLDKGRPAEAETVLRGVLAQAPEHGQALCWLALARSAQGEHDDATQVARDAIGVAPDDFYPHYVLANVLAARRHWQEAEKAARQALVLAPREEACWGLLSSVLLAQRRWKEALEAADKGLAIDPEHDACVQVRAMALNKLGRNLEASDTIQGALAREPESSLGHANQGWTLLHQNKPQQALEHFRESLRLDPENDWARTGITEALKARHRLYRILLQYKLKMDRLQANYQFALIIGAYVVYRFVLAAARGGGPLAPLWWTLTVLYLAFVVLTWFGDPLFVLLLRCSRFGRLAVDSRERWGSTLVGLGLLGAGGLALVGWLSGPRSLLIVALVLLLLCLPLKMVFDIPSRKGARWMAAYTLGCAVVGAAVLLGLGGLMSLYILACVLLSQFAAVAFARRGERE